MKKKVLVTGADGFVGANLVRELIKRDYFVNVLVKSGEEAKNIEELIENRKVKVFYGDLRKKETLRECCKGVEVIFHLGAKTDLSTNEYKPYYDINVLGTKNLVECCPRSLKRFIFYSSILAVGIPGTRELIDENYVGEPKHFYGRSKREVEDYLNEEFIKRGFPVTIVRPTTVYGPYEVAVQYYLFKVIKEGRFLMIGDGENKMSYVYVGNIVDATIKASNSQKTLGQTYIINDKSPYKFKDVIGEIYNVLGKRKPNFFIPYGIALVGAYIFEKLCKLFNIKPLIYPSRVKTMVLDYAYSIKKAERDFGYRPKYDLRMGIKATYEWYKSKGLL